MPARPSRPTGHLRRDAERQGRRAEWLCLIWLRFQFYRILETRFRCPVGEIDIIAKRGNTVAFIEVKARATRADAAYSLSARQRARIERAAAWYLAHRPHLAAATLRFDAMLVDGMRPPMHLADAWRGTAV